MDSGQSAYSYSYLTRLIKGFTMIKQELVIFRMLERLRRFGLVLILSKFDHTFSRPSVIFVNVCDMINNINYTQIFRKLWEYIGMRLKLSEDN